MCIYSRNRSPGWRVGGCGTDLISEVSKNMQGVNETHNFLSFSVYGIPNVRTEQQQTTAHGHAGTLLKCAPQSRAFAARHHSPTQDTIADASVWPWREMPHRPSERIRRRTLARATLTAPRSTLEAFAARRCAALSSLSFVSAAHAARAADKSSALSACGESIDVVSPCGSGKVRAAISYGVPLIRSGTRRRTSCSHMLSHTSSCSHARGSCATTQR